MSDLISKKELYHKLGEVYNKGYLTWGANEIIKDIIGECDSVEKMGDLISRERLINEWDDLGRRYAMPTTPIHKRAFREFPSADVRENNPIKFIPVNVDCRGYTDTFRCSKCGCDITTSYVMQELDYDFCPWCGGKADE